ncbi:MAG: M28 family peptidase, partial [Oscillospiraceae bacterium]
MNQTDQTILDGVLAQFYELCRRPHPSWGEGPLADYVEDLLRRRGLSPVRDEWNNLMADIPATPGRRNAPRVIVQGHLDMVCAVKPGSGYEPAISPVTPVVENGVLRSDGNSSLGADNNLGNAAVLWLLGQYAPHGPVRVLFTVAEEVGLQGAKHVDPSWLAGATYLINTDGFALGKAIVSSAGGLRETFSRPLETVPRRKNAAFALKLTDFPGGHSGYDIHRGRPNPIQLAALFLKPGCGQVDYELLRLSGGHAHNAIPMDCTALLAVEEKDVALLQKKVQNFSELFSLVYGIWGRMELTRLEEGPDRAWTTDCRDKVLEALAELTVGVYAWRDEEKEQVSASANLGRVEQTEDAVAVSCFIRAARQEDQKALEDRHTQTMARAGFSCQSDGYPGWPEREENPLADTLAAVWKDLTGRAMVIEAVHVGLEPSVLGAK